MKVFNIQRILSSSLFVILSSWTGDPLLCYNLGFVRIHFHFRICDRSVPSYKKW